MRINANWPGASQILAIAWQACDIRSLAPRWRGEGKGEGYVVKEAA
jgi:hypothetical protein